MFSRQKGTVMAEKYLFTQEFVDGLEAQIKDLKRQVEWLRDGVHSCGPTCDKAACVNRRLREEIAELKEYKAMYEGLCK